MNNVRFDERSQVSGYWTSSKEMILSMHTNIDQLLVVQFLEYWFTIPSWWDYNTDPEDVKTENFSFVLGEIEKQPALSPKILWQLCVQCYCPIPAMLRYIIIGEDNMVNI